MNPMYDTQCKKTIPFGVGSWIIYNVWQKKNKPDTYNITQTHMIFDWLVLEWELLNFYLKSIRNSMRLYILHTYMLVAG